MSNTGARIAARFDLPRGLALVEPVVERRGRRRDPLPQQDRSGAAVEQRTAGADDSAAVLAVQPLGDRQETPAAPRMFSPRPAPIGAEANENAQAPPGTAEPATVEKPGDAKDPAGERGVPRPAAARAPSGTQRKPPAPDLAPPDRGAAPPAAARKPQQVVAAPNVKPAGFPEAVGEHTVSWDLTAPNPGGNRQGPELRQASVRFPRAAPASDSPAHPRAAASRMALEPVPAGRSHPDCADPDCADSLERHTPEGQTTPLRILSQPLPRYPAQALEQRLQGDVLVDVEFRYSGTLEVLGVRKGLSARLNESALDAARQIRFLPARRDGRPVDTRATVCIRFQLDA